MGTAGGGGIVGENVDTWILSVRGEVGEDLAARLDGLKLEAQALEDDVPTPWRFCGEALFLKPHGVGRQWRWILYGPSLHLELGLGKRTGRVGKGLSLGGVPLGTRPYCPHSAAVNDRFWRFW